ncbi:hypothetical protein [Yersinia aleksiciae]|nr:hypothetical protein [Yersinia aleksiciae]
MSQLDGSAIAQIKDLTLSALFTNGLESTDCPVSVLPNAYSDDFGQ